MLLYVSFWGAALARCVQNITLDYDCQNAFEVELANKDCVVQFVVPNATDQRKFHRVCTKVLMSDLQEVKSQILANDLQDIDISIKVRLQHGANSLQNLTLFKFEKSASFSMRNVHLHLDVSDSEETGYFVQNWRSEQDARDESALVLKKFRIDAADECQFTLQDFVRLNKTHAVGFATEDLNNSFVCLDVNKVNTTEFAAVVSERSLFQNLRIKGTVNLEDVHFSALSHTASGQTSVQKCFIQLQEKQVYVHSGLFSKQTGQLKINNLFVRLNVDWSTHSYGLVQTSTAPIQIDTMLTIQTVRAKHEAAFLVGRSSSSVWLQQVTVDATQIEARQFALAMIAKLLSLQKCTVVIRGAQGDGAVLQFSTNLFSSSHVIAKDSQFEVSGATQGSVGLVFKLQQRSVLELDGVEGSGCPAVVVGKGDVFGQWNL